MLYFEEAIVRTYYRDKEKKNPFNQINLKKDSKFNPNPEEPEEVGVVRLQELINFINKFDGTELKELEAKYNELQEENNQLKEEVDSLKKVAEDLASDVHKLKEEKIQLQEENNKLQKKLLKAEDKKEDIIQLQKEHKKELEELNVKLNNEKDYSKALLIALLDSYKRNWLERIRNIEPESTTKVLTLRPIEIEAEVHEEQEE